MKISIIIPAYNCQDCLERSVRSVCAQTHSDLELIIVDDGSADSTGEIADALALTDPRIRVLHQSNGGTSRARNAGIRTAKGEYIGFVDADDDIEPDMYERLLGFILEKGLKCAQICRDERAADGKPLPMVVTPPEKPKIIDSKDFLKELRTFHFDQTSRTNPQNHSEKRPQNHQNSGRVGKADFYHILQKPNTCKFRPRQKKAQSL